MTKLHMSILCVSVAVIALSGCSKAQEVASVDAVPQASAAGEMASATLDAAAASAMGAQDLTSGPAPSEPAIPAGSVELTLKDDLDGNLNGYCFDIVGGGNNINPAGGLQAHTCYSYRGSLGSDQAFDPALIPGGTLYMPAWDVCAQVENPAAGSKIALASCDGSPAQQFTLVSNGTITTKAAPQLCATAGTQTVRGRNGTSPHQIKTLTMEPCDASLGARQEWRMRMEDD